jgi:hypothetical protein
VWAKLRVFNVKESGTDDYRCAVSCMRVPCHLYLTRPPTVRRGGGLQTSGVTANILNKQYETADKEWFSRSRFRRGDNILWLQKFIMLVSVIQGLGLGTV